MAVQPQTLDDQPVEMARQIVGEEETAGFRLRQRLEIRRSHEELVAVRSGNALHAFFPQHVVQQPSGAAIAIGDEDAAIAAAAFPDLGPHPLGDLGRGVVPAGGQAGDGDIPQTLALDHGQHLAGESAARDDDRSSRLT
jgi:hypothetical protein